MSEVASLSTIQPDPIIKLLNEELTFDQKEIFIESFALYLQYDEETDFVVELNEALCARLGYSRKDPAKRTLLKHFTEGEDYKISLHKLVERSGSVSKGGENQEKIMLNVRTLKEFSMVANTPEAKIFKKYYISMERILHKHSKRQLEEHQKLLEQQREEKLELTNQLQQLQIQSNQQLQESNKEKEKEREEKERLAAELENLKKTKKYVEIEKTGCNYTLKTDSLDFYRNGMSKNKDCKNRVSAHQTSNEQEIEVLHEFKTSCPKLLESCIHYALEVYRSNSGREFFKCKLDHIVNIVNIIGHVIDTCRSSNENITRQELIEKILEKLEFTGEITETTQEKLQTGTEENVSEKLECVVDLRQWLIKHISRSDDGKVQLKDIVEFYTGRTKIHSSESSKIKINIELFLRENFKLQNNLMLTSSFKTPDGSKQTFRGWKGFILLT